MRFLIVGSFSNVALYLLYLLLTSAGLSHKLAMPLLYVVGSIQTFFFNKRWTFMCAERKGAVLARYLAVYVLCFFVHYGAMILFVDRIGWPHEPVQAALILFMAAMLFTLQKLWVFKV